jgi:hypothetical protein
MNNMYKEIQALNRLDLLPRGKTLYLALMEIADSKSKCKPILASLVHKSGMSESTVIRATKELEAAGFISVVRFNKRGPSTLPNVYTLTHRTAQSSRIDSTSPVKLTGKNINNIDKDSTTSLTNNTACHPDTRGFAPSIRDDRPEYIDDLIYLLKRYDSYNYVEEEVLPLALEIVESIGIDEFESKLQEAMYHNPSLAQPKLPTLDWLKNIFEQIQVIC